MDKTSAFGEISGMEPGVACSKENSHRPGAFARFRVLFSEAKATLKKDGFKGLFRQFGWKLFVAIFAYYLIRDVTLYVLIPWFIAKRLISG
jgi:hypothetical protein